MVYYYFFIPQIQQIDADLHSSNKGTLPGVTIQIKGPPGFTHQIPITGATDSSLFITICLFERESLCNECHLYKFSSVLDSPNLEAVSCAESSNSVQPQSEG